MGRIFYIIGKSASGKDHIFEKLIGREELGLERMQLYTTRPKRNDQEKGYIFTDQEGLERWRKQGKVIEERVYQTIQGPWYYFTVDDGLLQPSDHNYLGIGTLESFQSLCACFGHESVCPIYIWTEDRELLLRAIQREEKRQKPDYAEVCRRFLADEKDFSLEKLNACGITRGFENRDLDVCVEEIAVYISGLL